MSELRNVSKKEREMDVKEILHMNMGDDGDITYAEHSQFPQMLAEAAKPLLESAVSSLFLNNSANYEVLHAADLGCAAGPNTFMFMRTVMDSVKKSTNNIPQIQFYLNDLPGNDFNSLFKGLSNYDFEDGHPAEKDDDNKKMIKWFAVASAGSFYDHLFPSKTMHFIYSSYSAHWLSKVPSGVVDEQSGVPVNKGSIYISETSSPAVKKAYLDQFRDDFTKFLKCRSSEMLPNGILFLILHGRQKADIVDDKGATLIWDLLSKALSHLIFQGLVDQEKLDSFNLPYYIASKEELTEIVEKEGSFSIQQLDFIVVDGLWKPNSHGAGDPRAEGENLAARARVFTESIISSYFGKEAMDPLYSELARLFDEKLSEATTGKYMRSSIVLVLRRKEAVEGYKRINNGHI